MSTNTININGSFFGKMWNYKDHKNIYSIYYGLVKWDKIPDWAALLNLFCMASMHSFLIWMPKFYPSSKKEKLRSRVGTDPEAKIPAILWIWLFPRNQASHPWLSALFCTPAQNLPKRPSASSARCPPALLHKYLN